MGLHINEGLNGNVVGGLQCWVGTVFLSIVAGTPGDFVTLSSVGNPQQGGNWNEFASGTVNAGGTLLLQIPLIEHCECLSGTISVQINGAPATLDVYLGGVLAASNFAFPLFDPCF
jgi:hypothetical protein